MDVDLDLAYALLDRLLVDLSGTPLGRVDDVELSDPAPGAPPRVVALLCGPLALGPRIGHELGEVWAAFGRRMRGRGDDAPVRIPWPLVVDVRPGEVRLGITADEAPTLDLERWCEEHVISRIPGAEA
jgi:hypothetical protein